MTRKTIAELQQMIVTLFPDNTSGEITPADLRDFCTDFVDTMTPAYGGLQTIPNTVKNIGTTDLLLAWNTSYIAQAPEFTTNPVTGTIRRDQNIATTRLIVNADIVMASNRELTVTLYKNGVPTIWRASCSGSGTGRPVVLSLEALDYSDVPADYQLFAQTDAANTAVTISNAIFIANAVPVRTGV